MSFIWVSLKLGILLVIGFAILNFLIGYSQVRIIARRTKTSVTVRKFTARNVWIDHFASSVPAAVPRPLLLICDGCSSHIRLDTVERCERRQVLLVCLPPNATHLVQPLDVAVFRPFKQGITSEITKIAARSSATTLSKESAVRIASKAFVEHVAGKQNNIKNGFAGTGLFPPSIDKMMRRLNKFASSTKRGDQLGSETWLQIREEVRTEVLLLPPKRQKTQRHKKTIDVGGRLLTKELLMQKKDR